MGINRPPNPYNCRCLLTMETKLIEFSYVELETVKGCLIEFEKMLINNYINFELDEKTSNTVGNVSFIIEQLVEKLEGA